MEKFRDLEINGNAVNLNRFLDELTDDGRGWQHNKSIEQRMLPLHSHARLVALDTPSGKPLRSATLFLFLNRSETNISLSNIVPDVGALSYKEYNDIVTSFYKDCVQDREEALSLIVMLSPDEVQMENAFSPRVMTLLNDFARNANKNTGSANPYDYRRWLDFIAASAREEEIISPDLMQQWLTEQGFPGDVAADLSHEYQFGVDLTKHWLNRPQGKENSLAAR